jgi:hypothetical protein
MNETQHNRRSAHGRREVQRQRRKARIINVLFTAGAICLVGIFMLVLRGGMFQTTNAETEQGYSSTVQESGASSADSQESETGQTEALDGQNTTEQPGKSSTLLTQEEKATYIKANPTLYTKDLVELIDKNSETIDYVYEYPEKKDATYTIDLTAEAQSDTVPLIMQWDERWGYVEYGSGMIGYTGCGPTCLSMVVLYFTSDPQYTPLYMADMAVEKGYCVAGNGTSWTMMAEGPSNFGLTSTELPMVEKKMTDALDEGKLIILNLGPGDFTTTGHYIVVTGYTDEGFTVNDPNSRERSAKTWTFQRLENQVKNLWAIGN